MSNEIKTRTCERCSREINRKGRCLPCNYLYKYKSWIRGLKEAEEYDSNHEMSTELVKKLIIEKKFKKQKMIPHLKPIISDTDTKPAEIIEKEEHTNSHEVDYSKFTPLEVAQKVFGFNGLKENGQKEIIEFIIKKKGNVMGIMPTGGGKSACFQIPALIQKNMTLVVSPLIALMKDQVESLEKKGIHSAFRFNSHTSDLDKEKIISLIQENKVKMLYIAPESLQSEKIQTILSKTKIDLVVIDEAHCISTWGHDFRPDYLKLREIIENLGSPPVLALTATATKKVIEDIKKQLQKNFKIVKASFDRPLLYLVVRDVPDNADKELFLLALVKKLKGPIIIFTRAKKTAENISDLLNKNGINSIYYHAGIPKEERRTRQDLFMNGECDIITATIAFGMGIDKNNIRNIIHYNLPQSIENYYQEIGRAGRDGNKSNCILLFSEGDVNKIKALISSDWPNKGKIEDLINYLKSRTSPWIFMSAKGLSYQTDIQETPIKLILHRLEEAGAIKRYSGVIHTSHITFNRNSQEIISACDKKYVGDLKIIFDSEYLKNGQTAINFEMLIEKTKINYFRFLEIFKYLHSNNYISITDEKNKDLIWLKKDLNLFDITPLVKLFQDILNSKYQKVDDLVKCLTSNKCIRRNILAYFDEPKLKNKCDMCSNCMASEIVKNTPMKLNENYASDEEINKICNEEIDVEKEELHMILLKAIGGCKCLPKKDFINILKGKLHRFSAKWKFELKIYGLLATEDKSELEDTLNKLISDSLVMITSEGELRITKKGIELINE